MSITCRVWTLFYYYFIEKIHITVIFRSLKCDWVHVHYYCSSVHLYIQSKDWFNSNFVLFFLGRFSMLSWTRSTTANLKTTTPQKSCRRCSRNSTACLIHPIRYILSCLCAIMTFSWLDGLFNILCDDRLQPWKLIIIGGRFVHNSGVFYLSSLCLLVFDMSISLCFYVSHSHRTVWGIKAVFSEAVLK